MNETNNGMYEFLFESNNNNNDIIIDHNSAVSENRFQEFDLTNTIPHCPVVLVLDTSHSMWGQGLTDMLASVNAFCKTIANVQFQNAQVDVAAVSMGDNLRMLEDFTPLASSNLPGLKIRPKGDTPIGAALELALDALKDQIRKYQSEGISHVTPNLILLSDGKSTDDFQAVAQRIREAVANGRLTCRAIALGNDTDMNALAAIAGKNNIMIPDFGQMRHTFENVGQMISQTYEEEAQSVIMEQAIPVDQHAGTEYLLDGSNILFWDEYRSGITMKYLLAITDHLKQSGQKFQVFFDATAPHLLQKKAPGEKGLYDSLLKTDPEHFRQVPAGTRADDFLLMLASSNKDALILSRDLFRDHVEKNPWLKTERRVIPGMIMNDVIFFPEISLNIPVTAPEKSKIWCL